MILPKQRGFTMIELIVVMVMIGILAVVVLPRFDLLRGFDEIGYRDKVKATLEYARKSAVAQRRYVCVTTASNVLSLQVETVTPETTGSGTCATVTNLALATPDRDCGGATHQICPRGSVTLTGPTPPLTFDALGRPHGTPNCVAPAPVSTTNYCYTVTGPSYVQVEAETGYVH